MADLLPVARTSAEAHVYMDLHPCDCGETAFDRASSVVETDDDLAGRYTGICPRCGEPREFVFRLPDQVLMPVPGTVTYGGTEASQLVDPGEWLWVADAYASAVPPDPTGPTAPAAPATARTRILAASAAMSEVLKFVPRGADGVPVEAIRSARGQQLYAAEPGRFVADRLRVVRDTYDELAAGVRDG